MWTFESETAIPGTWTQSGLRFDSIDRAAFALYEWVVISAANGFFPAVRLVKLAK